MEKIVLKKLHIENFQQFKLKDIEFGMHTVIRGDNGTGKTTTYSAMTWLLFGKDWKGRTDTGKGGFDLKRKENGKKVDMTDVIVEGLFSINGKDVTLKRVLHEIWTKGADARYTGDETLCFIDDVPKKVAEYQSFIGNIIEETEFRMITDINYFLNLPTKTQRQYLCSMGGVLSIEDICREKLEWRDFLNEITGKNLEDFLETISFQKKRLKEEASKIQPSINALEKSKPEEADWEGLEIEKNKVKSEIDKVNDSLSSEEGFEKKKQDEISELRKETSKYREAYYMTLQKIQAEKARLEIESHRIFEERNAERIKKEKEVEKLVEEQKQIESKLNDSGAQERDIKVNNLKKRQKELFNEYEKIRLEEPMFNFGICPLLKSHKCESPVIGKYVKEQEEEAYKAFNEAKTEKLRRIIEEGTNKSREIKTIQNEEAVLKERLSEIVQKIEILQTLILSIPQYEKTVINSELLESLNTELIARNSKIVDTEREIEKKSSESRPDTSELVKKRRELQNTLESIFRKLSEKEQIEKINRQIADYEEKGKDLNEKIADMDKKEFMAKEINRAQVTDATERVNNLFEFVKWQMFEQQKNGLFAEVCKPIDAEGASASLNTGKLINIGIDIVNTISRYKGICAPLFIDNHESVNESLPALGQEIDLYVAPKGTTLTIQII